MTAIEFYERDTVIKRIETLLNQINNRYFEGNHGILSVTDNGNYVTVRSRNGNQHFDVQGIFDALNNFGLDEFDDRDYYDIWDYLDYCKYTLPESQKLFVELENLLDKIDTYFSHRSKLSIEQQNDKVNICKNDECLSFFIEPLVTSLNNVSDIDHSFDDLWDYLKYEFQYHGVKSDNELKTDNELSFSEKTQVGLVNMLLGEPVVTKTSISNEELWEKNRELTKLVQELKWETLELTQSIEEMHDLRRRENKEGSEIVNHLMARIHELEQSKEYNEAWIDNLKQKVHDLESSVWLLQQETNQIAVLNESITQLHIRIHELEQENKQLKNQTEPKPEPQPEPKPTAKKRPKFKLPEDFADYQQECDDLVNALSCFYNIKKGKWNGNILQFILTPTDAEKAKHPYPNNWRAGLYLQPGQWATGKVNLTDPDEWEEWFMDIYDFTDANGIEIS